VLVTQYDQPLRWAPKAGIPAGLITLILLIALILKVALIRESPFLPDQRAVRSQLG